MNRPHFLIYPLLFVSIGLLAYLFFIHIPVEDMKQTHAANAAALDEFEERFAAASRSETSDAE